MNPYLQQWFARLAALSSGVTTDAIWENYTTIGGTCDAVEFTAYLHGLLQLDAFERDMAAHAINEILDNDDSPVRRAAYTTDTLSLASGVPTDSSFGSWTDQALRRFTTASADLFPLDRPESLRLRSLNQTRLMDSPPDERFDRITREAQATFGVSSSSIALIGQHRQFIKSVTGPIGSNGPRRTSFCAQTIRSEEVLVVRDALADDTFRDNPLVQLKPHIRFYAGHTLRGPGGWPIGTLCIIDDRPGEFSAADKLVLKRLAAEAQDQVEVFHS
ncbi:GAF domain-containing protein [Arthrobacter sp. H20]|uniref:GAF domain-containing protein n=1 Tax=Arthrobacter sp. H20 TaxID=1267981 RepID=UPI0004AEC6BA|nr:GAF domain-containing protein [Arthrobacter sp. H20]